MIDKTNLDCFRGDTKSWTFTAMDGEVPINLTGAKVWMTALRSSQGARVFQRTSVSGQGIVPDADQSTNPGKYVVTLASTNTSGLESDVAPLYYDIQVLKADAGVITVQFGDLAVTADATSEVV